MKTKATHTGTCQICGRTQKLPSGMLSLHGYTKEWGFFSGTCSGSSHLPFEQSISLIADAIEKASKQLSDLSAESLAWKNGKQLDGNLAWKHVYVSRNRFERGQYVWQHVQVISEQFKPISFSGNPVTLYSYAEIDADGKPGKPERFYPSGVVESIDAVRRQLNSQYAEQHLDKRVAGLDRYVKWQQMRIKDWKPSELKPVE